MSDDSKNKSAVITSPNLKALKLYIRYLLGFKKLAMLSLLFSLFIALQTVIVPLLIARVLDILIKQDIVHVGLLVFTGILQLGIVIAIYLLDIYGIAQQHHKVDHLLYRNAFNYLVRQDYSFFTNRFGGSLVTQASRFAKSYSLFTDMVFFDIIPQVTAVLIAVGIMTFYSPIIGLTVLAIWAICVYIVIVLGIRRLPMRRTAIAKESEQVGELADVITNAINVKTFAAEDIEIDRYEQINKKRGQYFIRSWFRAIRNGRLIEVFCVLLQMIVLAGGIFAVHQGQLQIATFLLFQLYILKIIDNIRRSSFIVRQLEVVAGDAQEMTELLEQPPDIQDPLRPKTVSITNGEVQFINTSFHYEDSAASQEVLFKNFNLHVKPGEKIGLVGPSGGGKTTITRLVLRFLDIQEGSITVDGHDIRTIRQQDLRRAIGYVAQEPLLFHRTITENIAYGRPNASDEEVIAVAKKSFAHGFIEKLPDGYNTLVGERGVKLSGGQRQRIAIARAMLKNAPILVLDEATSALDSESERAIQQALWELMKNKTAIVIAHRLSTIQKMDRIIVLNDGKIIEEGKHQDLLERKGLYAKLWAHQSGGFLED